jgi:hypothetical protein
VLAPENADQIVQARDRHPALTLVETRQITPVDGGDGFFYGTFNRIDQG